MKCTCDEKRYLWLKRASEFNSSGTLGKFYNKFLEPCQIFLFVTSFFTIIKNNGIINSFNKNDSNQYIYWCLVAFGAVTSIRLLQSCWLAKRDYSLVPNNMLDTIAFVTLWFFVLGFPFYFAPLISNAISMDSIFVLTCIYCIGSLIGIINFRELYKKRLSSITIEYDSPIELIIQKHNIITFTILFILLSTTAYLIFVGHSNYIIYACIFSSLIIFIILNIVHSHLLTYNIKLLLTNKADSTECIIADFGKTCQHVGVTIDDQKLLGLLTATNSLGKLEIRTVRATPTDIPFISNELVKNFGYIFEYIFKTQNNDLITNILNKLLYSSCGLGLFGYLHFYIVEHAQNKVGLIKIQTSNSYGHHSLLSILSSFFILIKYLGLGKAILAAFRLHKLQSNQNVSCRNDELFLEYVAICDHFQGKGLAKELLFLLKNAYLVYHTDGTNFNKLFLTARSGNSKAIRLFSSIGFEEFVNPLYNDSSDPIAQANPGVGKLIFMQLLRQS